MDIKYKDPYRTHRCALGKSKNSLNYAKIIIIYAEDEIVITDSMNMNLNKLQEIAEDRGTSKAHGIAKSWT